jgi:phosphoglycerate kinase
MARTVAIVLALVASASAFAPSNWVTRRGVALEAKKSVADVKDLKGKKVLVRCDLNVPCDKKTGEITDDTRIRASVPTLKYLLDAGAKVAACSHMGRPEGNTYEERKNKKFSLGSAATRMGEYIGAEVKLCPDCVGPEVEKMMEECKEGQLIILENTRFYKEEEKNNEEFAKKMAAPFDMFVNDAFGTAHRAHASTEGVTKYLKTSVAGFLLAKELEYLDGAIKDGEKPLAAIVGGSKVSSKITVLTSLIEKCNKVIIGGGMVFTFLAAQGIKTGSSLVEADYIETAKEAMALAKSKGCEFILPEDIVVADKFAPDAKTMVVKATEIPDGWMGLDNGPAATASIQKILSDCKTVIWNGPMGVFEFDAFAAGTLGVAQTLAEITKTGACTIIGGGDSVAAVEKAGLADQMSHISTGGGASLELLEGKVLPGVAALQEA